MSLNPNPGTTVHATDDVSGTKQFVLLVGETGLAVDVVSVESPPRCLPRDTLFWELERRESNTVKVLFK